MHLRERPTAPSSDDLMAPYRQAGQPAIAPKLFNAPPVQRTPSSQPSRDLYVAPAHDAATAAIAAGVASYSEGGALVFRSPEPALPPPTPPAAPAPPAPAPVPLQRTTVASSPPAAPAKPEPPDLDELAMRLYPKLRPYLRKDLWLDRERAGLLADLR